MSLENLLYFLSSLSLVAFLFFCVKPYFLYFKKFFGSEDPEKEKSDLNLNNKHRILEEVLSEEIKMLRSLNFEKKSSLGIRPEIKKLNYKNYKLKVCIQRQKSKIKITVSPDSVLGGLYAVEKYLD